MGKLNKMKIACMVVMACFAITLPARAQTYTIVTNFNAADGYFPTYGPLVQGADGNFYGTTTNGGANSLGSVFELTPSGELITLYSFCSQTNCADGKTPAGGLVQARGHLYGITTDGGAVNWGTVFEITAPGKLTTLYNFCSQLDCADGVEPSWLTAAVDGNLYGTTLRGGANDVGTVFKITPAGRLTTLYSFCVKFERNTCADGASPNYLMQGSDGDFYGTTNGGGTGKCYALLCGTIFKITPGGKLRSLFAFVGPNGGGPAPGLLQDASGNFYGITVLGGATRYGTFFEMTPTGDLTTLYNFCPPSLCTDGLGPNGVVLATDGNFYGTSSSGGANGQGSVFKLTPEGGFSTVYSFCSETNCSDGENPMSALVQGSDGNLIGTTDGGGANGDGSIFSLSINQGSSASQRSALKTEPLHANR